jgi:hypothetical protein
MLRKRYGPMNLFEYIGRRLAVLERPPTAYRNPAQFHGPDRIAISAATSDRSLLN